MGDHKIKINIGIYDEMDNISQIISAKVWLEKAFLKANKELMKKSIPSYLEAVLKM